MQLKPSPGCIGDLYEGQAPPPLWVVVQDTLQGQELQLDALEQVHVVHSYHHCLPLELHRQRSTCQLCAFDMAMPDA